MSENRAQQFAELNRMHMEAYKDAISGFRPVLTPRVEFLGVVAIITVFWYGGLKALAGVGPDRRACSPSCNTRSDSSSPFRI